MNDKLTLKEKIIVFFLALFCGGWVYLAAKEAEEIERMELKCRRLRMSG